MADVLIPVVLARRLREPGVAPGVEPIEEAVLREASEKEPARDADVGPKLAAGVADFHGALLRRSEEVSAPLPVFAGRDRCTTEEKLLSAGIPFQGAPLRVAERKEELESAFAAEVAGAGGVNTFLRLETCADSRDPPEMLSRAVRDAEGARLPELELRSGCAEFERSSPRENDPSLLLAAREGNEGEIREPVRGAVKLLESRVPPEDGGAEKDRTLLPLFGVEKVRGLSGREGAE